MATFWFRSIKAFAWGHWQLWGAAKGLITLVFELECVNCVGGKQDVWFWELHAHFQGDVQFTSFVKVLCTLPHRSKSY